MRSVSLTPGFLLTGFGFEDILLGNSEVGSMTVEVVSCLASRAGDEFSTYLLD